MRRSIFSRGKAFCLRLDKPQNFYHYKSATRLKRLKHKVVIVWGFLNQREFVKVKPVIWIIDLTGRNIFTFKPINLTCQPNINDKNRNKKCKFFFTKLFYSIIDS